MSRSSVFSFASVAALAASAFFMGYLVGSGGTSRSLPPAAARCGVTPAVVTNSAPAASVTNAVAASASVTNVVAADSADAAGSRPLKVLRTEYDSRDTLTVWLSARADPAVARHYVSAGPLNAGVCDVTATTSYDCETNRREPVLRIRGDFAYRTNLTLTVRRGLPRLDRSGGADGALTNDYVYAFRRRDAPPSVRFVAPGRYLPPVGNRRMEIEALNVTNVLTEVRRIVPQNLVQLLAREEGAYRRYWSGSVDAADTEELSAECEQGEIRCRCLPNQSERLQLAVKMNDGGPDRGMYLVMIRSRDRGRDDFRWSDGYNPNVYRVVCVSDLGVSVRECGGRLGVWVTSLTGGTPVPNAKVEAYSSANVLVAEGRSGADGWCVPRRCADGEPFAVVVSTGSGDDRTFLALRDSMRVSEDECNCARSGYLAKGECAAFLWTERGIYRHDERIFLHGILRDDAGGAPKPMPVELRLRGPDGREIAKRTLLSDAAGVVVCEDLVVPAERPSGDWTIVAKVPGEGGAELGSRTVKIEEFAPPQIRVRIAADETRHPTNLAFRISAEHLFGGPARQLACEGAVVFEDVAFAPAKWKGWNFGDETLGLRPCYRQLSQRVLDDAGECEYESPLFADAGLPRAALKATVEGTVFEDGGRPATARKSMICHYYPYYIGSDLGGWMKLPPAGPLEVDLALVDPEGDAVGGVHSLTARLERIESIYSYRRNGRGEYTWDCERVKSSAAPDAVIVTDDGGRARYALPARECGDYMLTVTDGTGGSFAKCFYLSCWGDDAVRAPLSDPTAVTISTDRPFYRVGETPRLLVKSPFAGWAMLTAMRDREVYSEIVNLTNATSVITLPATARDWAPNVDVYLSVVQSVSGNAKHLAARAHGQTTVAVRPAEDEIGVTVGAEVEMKGGDGTGAELDVSITAKGASHAVVTVVDEGINLLTEEKPADPVGFFAQPRRAEHPLFDIFHRVLPVTDEDLRVGGVKTGGDFGAEMLGRVSPEPTRRFKPLALWKARVPLADGSGRVGFRLPEFVGEVRVTAVAYSDRATGSASVRKKIAPDLVIQPDAPRFVAPGDEFTVTMPVRNMTKGGGSVDCVITSRFLREVPQVTSRGVRLAAGGSTNVIVSLKAPKAQGRLAVVFTARGFGEAHRQTIEIPVRPAVAWRESTGVARVEDETSLRASLKEGERFAVKRCETPADELVSAYRWLADYPHGCLEQTASRIFPLLSGGLGVVSNREEYVAAGVRRVESMIRENDFVMWPDCGYAPWDREVSLYAAHFLIEADRSGVRPTPASLEKVRKFLAKWAVSSNDCESAYACHDLALAGRPDRDRMLRLYDRAESLDALSRARLARAFALDRDFRRAERLLAYAYDPQDVREAAFTALAMLEIDPDDQRVFPIVEYLMKNRVGDRFHWGTTGENAHALLAIGAYYRAHPGEEKEPYLIWRKFTLPEAEEVKDDSAGVFVDRRYYRPDGEPADLSDLVCGEMLIARLVLTTDVSRVVNDLVIEDLFPAAFEPVMSTTVKSASLSRPSSSTSTSSWVMRSDARDDRMLVFSKRFTLEKDEEAVFEYPVRVVTAGDFVLPGPSVEGMYNPRLHSRRAPGRIVVRH